MFNRVLISTLPFISSIIAAPVMRAYSPHHDFDFEHDVIGTRAKGALISTQRGRFVDILLTNFYVRQLFCLLVKILVGNKVLLQKHY